MKKEAVKNIMLLALVVLCVVLVFICRSQSQQLKAQEGSKLQNANLALYTVATSLRVYEYDEPFVRALYSFDAHAWTLQDDNYMQLGERLVNLTNPEVFEKLSYEDAIFISDAIFVFFGARYDEYDSFAGPNFDVRAGYGDVYPVLEYLIENDIS